MSWQLGLKLCPWGWLQVNPNLVRNCIPFELLKQKILFWKDIQNSEGFPWNTKTFWIVTVLNQFTPHYHNQREKSFSLTYLGRLGHQYTSFGAQTLAPKNHFSCFVFLVVFQQKNTLNKWSMISQGEGNLIFCCTGQTDPTFQQIKIITTLISRI